MIQNKRPAKKMPSTFSNTSYTSHHSFSLTVWMVLSEINRWKRFKLVGLGVVLQMLSICFHIFICSKNILVRKLGFKETAFGARCIPTPCNFLSSYCSWKLKMRFLSLLKQKQFCLHSLKSQLQLNRPWFWSTMCEQSYENNQFIAYKRTNVNKHII